MDEYRMQWIAGQSVPAQLWWPLFFGGYWDSCWGSLSRWQHLSHEIFKIKTKNVFSFLLPTFGSTALSRTKRRVHWIPKSRSSCRVGGTSNCVSITLAATTFGNKWSKICASLTTIAIMAVLRSGGGDTKVTRYWRKRWTFEPDGKRNHKRIW